MQRIKLFVGFRICTPDGTFHAARGIQVEWFDLKGWHQPDRWNRPGGWLPKVSLIPPTRNMSWRWADARPAYQLEVGNGADYWMSCR